MALAANLGGMIALTLFAHLAFGAPVSDAQLAEAKGLYQQALRDFDAGRFELSIREFLAADLIQPKPALAYDVAQVYEKLGNRDQAIVYLLKYLERAPDASNRGAVEATLKTLRNQPANAVVVVTTAGPPPGPDVELAALAPVGAVEQGPAKAPAGHSHAVGIALTVTGAVAAAFAVVGLANVISYNGLSGQVQNGTYSGSWANVVGSRSNAENWGTVGIVCTLVAVGAGIGAAVTW